MLEEWLIDLDAGIGAGLGDADSTVKEGDQRGELVGGKDDREEDISRRIEGWSSHTWCCWVAT